MRIDTRFAAAIVAVLLTAPAGAAEPSSSAPRAMVRVTCDGESAGAAVSINGEFKGDCPIDTPVPAGSVTLRAVKPVGETKEAVFQQDFNVGGGVVKRVEVILGAPTFTAQGRVLEDARIAREQERAAEEKRVADEKARAAAEAKAVAQAEAIAAADANARPKNDALAADLLAKRRGSRKPANPACPDCPVGNKKAGGVAADLPTSDDPTLQGMLDLARQEIAKIGTKDSELVPPAQSISIPCPGADAEIRKLAGVRNFSEMSAAERRPYSGPTFMPRIYVIDAKVWPVQAACTDGKLDGPLDAWVFATQVSGSRDAAGRESTLSAMPILVHLQTIMAAGQPSALIVKHQRFETLSYYFDPQVRSTVATYLNNTKDADVLAFSYALPESMGDAKAVSVAVVRTNDKQWIPMTTVTTPLKPNLVTETGYHGKQIRSKAPKKDGVYHGEYVFYEYYIKPDVKSPQTSLCYRDGEIVSVRPCVFD